MSSRIMRFLFLFFVVLTVGIIACDSGGDDNSNPVIPNSDTLGTVSGFVYDDDTDLPISGATIVSDDSVSATSGEDGSYTMDISLGDRTLIASAQGYEPQQKTVTTLDDFPKTKRFDLNPIPVQEEISTVTGTIISAEDSSAVQSAIVTCDGEDVYTNSSGVYTVVVSVGTHTVSVVISGFVAQEQEVECLIGETQTVDFVLEPAYAERGTVHGKVFDGRSNDPIPGARVAYGDDEIYSDNSGDYEILLNPGSHVIVVSAAGYVTLGQDVEVAVRGNHILDYAMDASGVGEFGMVTGQVLDATTNSPIGGVRLSCVTEVAVTDGHGVYSFRVPAGNQVILAQANGYNSVSLPVVIISNQVHSLSFTMTPIGGGDETGILQGRVTDASNGGGINAATVACAGRTTRTDASGNYSLQVPIGNQSATASQIGYTSQSRQVAINAGQHTTQNFTLSPGGGGGDEFGNVSGRISDSSNNHGIYLALVECGGKTTRSDFSGNYLLSDVAVGNQTVDVSAEGYHSASYPVVVIANQTSTVNIAMAPDAGSGTGRISGRVTNSGGSPIAGATVRSDDGPSTSTDGSGRYQFDVGAGNRSITASAGGYSPSSQNLAVQTNRSYTVNFVLTN